MTRRGVADRGDLMNDGRRHWFAFSYQGECSKSGKPATASTYTDYAEKVITMARIEENKRYAGVNPGAVLLGVSYLGYMTREEFLADQGGGS